MVGEPELVGLLYRADWTRLSLAAGVVKRTGAQPDDERGPAPDCREAGHRPWAAATASRRPTVKGTAPPIWK